MSERFLASVLPRHETAELYRLMVVGIKECAVFLMDPQGIITVLNKAAEEMKGYTADDTIGHHLRMLYTEKDRGKGVPEHNLEMAAEHGYHCEEAWRRRKDGGLFWARVAITALRDPGGALLGFSKVTLDLTKHKLLEQCQREKDEIDFILRAAEAGTWKWDVAGRVSISRHLLQMLGFELDEAELAFDTWLEYVHPEDRDRLRERLTAVRTEPAAVPFEMDLRLLRKDRDYQWFFMRANWHRDGVGGALVLMGACVGIDSLKQAQLAAATERERAQVTLAAITDGVITTDRAGIVTSMNPAAERLTGIAQRQARGQPVKDVLCFDEQTCPEQVFDAITRCLEQRRVISDLPSLTLIGPGDHRYAVEVAVAPVALADGELIGAVFVFHDVTESKQLLRRLGFEASHDALTGLVNRREFETRLQRALDRALHPGGASSALLYMDLDQFKIVNDTCGHSAGDDLLTLLAQSYAEHVRERDTLARIGGDEFAMIVEHCEVEEALAVANKMLEATRNFRYTCKGRLFQLGVSIGVAAIDDTTRNVEEALRSADHACYIAKERGRNRVYVHYKGDLDFAQRRSDMHWVTRLSHAFRNNQLQLYCQPIMALGEDDQRLHYEILLRLKNGRAAPIGPAIFLPAAERYDVILKIDRWVLGRTLEWLSAHPEHTEELDMCSINLSRRSLGDQSFHKFAAELIDQTDVPARKLCFEITESGAIADMQKTIAFIEALSARGCRFSLDDFGTGMTSFSYLKQLPVDFIKIDGSFIQMMSSSEVDYEMVRFTNDISHMMGRKTIAEYVTDPAILAKLKRIGVDFAQGYWVGKPRPLDMQA